MRARVLSCLLASAVLWACGGDSGPSRVTGDTGYVRCLAAEPPAARSWRVGDLRLTAEERSLGIDGAPSQWRLAAFSGPVDAPSIRALRASRPHVAVLLGGAGEDAAEVARTLALLAELGVPALVVAGGEDRHDLLARGFAGLEGAARERVIHASGLRSIRIGAVELVPVAGAPEGRYALDGEACGLSSDDAAAIAEAVGAPGSGVHRYLLSFAAPRTEGAPSSGIASVEAGSPLVSQLLERARAEGAVFAWPYEGAGRALDAPMRVAVGPLAGAFAVRGDGSRAAPGATVLTGGPRGLEAGADSP